jgi:hypothetical protein
VYCGYLRKLKKKYIRGQKEGDVEEKIAEVARLGGEMKQTTREWIREKDYDGDG